MPDICFLFCGATRWRQRVRVRVTDGGWLAQSKLCPGRCLVDWVGNGLGLLCQTFSPQAVFTKILSHYRNYCGSLEVLSLVLKHFSPDHYAPFALEMTLLIKQVGAQIKKKKNIFEVRTGADF